jgi:hypothetical protein
MLLTLCIISTAVFEIVSSVDTRIHEGDKKLIKDTQDLSSILFTVKVCRFCTLRQV